MYQGNYTNRRKPRRRYHRRKPSLLLIALVAVLGAVVGSTIAYLFTHTDAITNTFTAASVTTKIEEELNDGVKNNVTVKNTGDIEAYIRAAVIVTWQDKYGNVYSTAPEEGVDYTVDWTMDGWVLRDGYYYYTSPVAAKDSTKELFTNCMLLENTVPPEGCHLVVEVLASAIQSQPKSAVVEAWGVDPTNLKGR